jgi:leucyl-tRNA synthetase
VSTLPLTITILNYFETRKAFLSAINSAIIATEAAYEATQYREARKVGFNELQNRRDWYRDYCAATGDGMHRDLIVHFISTQALLIAPIIPHTSEKIWGLLGHKDSIMNAAWPKAGHVDNVISKALDYLQDTVHTLRVRIATMLKPKKAKKGAAAAAPPVAPTKGVIFVASEYPEWQRVTLAVLDTKYDAKTNDFPDARELLPELKKLPELADKAVFKNVMPFIAFVRVALKEKGRDALASVLPFDEMAVVTTNAVYIAKACKVATIVVAPLSELTDAKLASSCKPGAPVSLFTSD